MINIFWIVLFSIFLSKTIDIEGRVIFFDYLPKEIILQNSKLSLSSFGIDVLEHNLVYEKDPISKTEHYTLNQYIEGIPVFARYAKVHFSDYSNNASISIDFFKGDCNSSVLLNQEEVIKIVEDDFNSQKINFQNINKQYYVKEGDAHISYFIDAITYDKAFTYIISAGSGEILNKLSLIHTEGPALGSGINLLNELVEDLNIYDGGSFLDVGSMMTPYLVCQEYCWDYGDCMVGGNYDDCTITPSQGSCSSGYLEDCNGDCFSEWYLQFPGVGNGFCNEPWISVSDGSISSGQYNLIDESNLDLGTIFTINSYGGFYEDISYVNNNNNSFDSEQIALSHQSGVSAHDYQRKTLDYMWNHHNYAGIDGNGKRTISVVNYGAGGGISQNNAFFNAGIDALSYGIAGGDFRPFCAAQDIVAHEFTHGFTAHSSGLIYQNQAGALNESLSDAFGYFVEAEYQNGGDWTEGEDVRISGGASRSFINPPLYGDPDNINHPYFVPHADNPNMFTNDFGGVHSNSGIPNKVLYLVVEGDEHYGINVESFDEDILESRLIASDIWYHWNRYYLSPEDNFEIAREKMLQVSRDLWPINYKYYQTISNAWASVGVGEPILAGDLNNDMIVNIQDIVFIINIILGNFTPTSEQVSVGDLNFDSLIDVSDIILIINIIFDLN